MAYFLYFLTFYVKCVSYGELKSFNANEKFCKILSKKVNSSFTSQKQLWLSSQNVVLEIEIMEQKVE